MLEEKFKKIIWTDEVRLGMIEKSEFFNNPQVYQYGYYDGFHKGVSIAKEDAILFGEFLKENYIVGTRDNWRNNKTLEQFSTESLYQLYQDTKIDLGNFLSKEILPNTKLILSELKKINNNG